MFMGWSYRGKPMPEMILQYPVHTLDGKLLLPAGAMLNEQVLEEIAASNWQRPDEQPLLQYGCIRNDLHYFLDSPAYRSIRNNFV